MLLVERQRLTWAVEGVLVLAHMATTVDGLRVVWRPESWRVERGILALLSTLSPGDGAGAVIPDDTVFCSGFGTDYVVTFPPARKQR